MIRHIWLISFLMIPLLGGKATYIDIKLNYLSGKDKIIAGADNDKDERLELLISLLDGDGKFATTDINGDRLKEIKIKSELLGNNIVIKSHQLSINRSLSKGRNIGRYIIDYSNAAISSNQQDVLTIEAGGKSEIRKPVMSSGQARGLVVRIAPHSDFKTKKYINQLFTNIEMDDEAASYKLSEQSSRSPGGVSGISVPIRIYASTNAPSNDDTKRAYRGRFTLAPNLENRKVIVKVVADYDGDGTASTVIDTKSFLINSGIVKANIKINNALPIQTDDVNTFETTLVGGLPIAFIAYVEDNITIANKPDLDADTISTFTITGK